MGKKNLISGLAFRLRIFLLCAVCVLYGQLASAAAPPAKKVVPAIAPSLQVEPSVKLQIEQAWQAYGQKDYTKVESALLPVVSDPQLPVSLQKSLRVLLAEALVKQNKWLEAQEQFEKAIAIYQADLIAQPSQPTADRTTLLERLSHLTSQLGYAYWRSGNYDASQTAFLKALDESLEPLPPAGQKANAATAVVSENQDEAGQTQLDYIVYNIANLVYQLRENKQQAQALALLQAVDDRVSKKEVPPTKAFLDLYAHAGGMASGANQYQAAVNAYDRAYQIAHYFNDYSSPNWPVILRGLGYSAYAIGDYAKAGTAYQELLTLNKTNRVLSPDQEEAIRRELTEFSKMDQSGNYVNLLGKNVTRWNDKTQVITVYNPSGKDLALWKPELDKLLEKAFSQWQKAMQGRIQFAFTNDPKKYDVEIFWSAHESDKGKNKSQNENKLGYNMMSTWGEYIAKSDIYLYLDKGSGQAMSELEFYNTCLHEIGHLLGITAHSNNPDDVMYKSAHINSERHGKLSERDIATVNALYEIKPAVSNPEGIYLSEFEKFRKKQMADLECQDAPVITVNFDLPGAYGGQQDHLVCRKKARPRDQIPIYMPNFAF